MRTILRLLIIIAFAATIPLAAQIKNVTPVTTKTLLDPPPSDWLMLSRTYDEQRFSPLKQIDKKNVHQLRLVWSRGMPRGTQETIPIVHDGVMYVINPGAAVDAVDATNGDLIWEYKRKLPEELKGAAEFARPKSLAIFQDLIFYTAPDGYLVALDARTGNVRWEVQDHDPKTGAQATSAPIVVNDKVITARSCNRTRAGCFIAAHDASTGEEVWKFFDTAAPGEPGGDTWGGVPVDKRIASTWGLPGSFDPMRNLIYWGIANPTPFARLKRHDGNVDAVPRSAPADLYSDSTVALNPDTGKLAWYYQHLPGDDWDLDHTHERVLFRTTFNPDPKAVKWINPTIPRGQPRDVAVEVAEAGGIWVLDRTTGQFLWATPFPYDVPEFHISKIDVETGKTYINWDLVKKKNGDRSIVCFNNTKGYFPMAYSPENNSLYIPYVDTCVDMDVDTTLDRGFRVRDVVVRPGADPNALGGLARVDMSTGVVRWRYTQRAPTVGAVLATAGGLVFWGDMNRRFRAFDQESGNILWEALVGGIVQNSTITYAVGGKQYIAVMTGDGMPETELPMKLAPELKTPRGHNEIYVYALPPEK